MPSRPVVGIFGHYGNRNLGDEAIVAAAIEQVRRRLEDVEVVCISLRPDDTASRHGVECFSVGYAPEFPDPVRPTRQSVATDPRPRRREGADESVADTPHPIMLLKNRLKTWPIVGLAVRIAARSVSTLIRAADELKFVFRSAAYLRRVDLLIVAGSNQFLDNFQGTWGFPYTLLKWSLLARLMRTRVAYVSVGAGPLDRPLSKLFVRLAVKLADYASYRDIPSKALVEKGWPRVDCPVYPDLAFGLSDDSLERSGATNGNKPIVGINPMPVYDSRYWFEHDDLRYQEYVEKIAGFSAKLILNNYRVFFFPTMWRDNDVIRDVFACLRAKYDLEIDEKNHFEACEQVHELVAAIAEADIVVSTRFHGIVLPYSLGLPVLGIGYYRKSLALMHDMGQAAYHEPLDDFSVDSLWEKLLTLEANWDTEHSKIAETTAEYREQIAAQWDIVTGLATSPRE